MAARAAGDGLAGERRALIEADPDHASLYLLELYPNAPLKEDMARAGWSLAPDEDAAEMYLGRWSGWKRQAFCSTKSRTSPADGFAVSSQP